MRRIYSFLLVFVIILNLSFVSAESADVDYSKKIEMGNEKEKIVFDFPNGHWSYKSEDLDIEIHRYNSDKPKRIWYIAHVKFSDNTKIEHFFADQDKIGKAFKLPELIARNNKSVFAINDDQVGYRIYNHKTVGHVVHDGHIIGNKTYKNKMTILPNLDVMAIDDNGFLSVFDYNEHTAEEYIDMGYKMVASFGPWLIRKGEINPFLDKNYTLGEERCTIGMVDKNHYVFAVCDGRRKGITEGASLKWMAETLKSEGATEAFNLDGGDTTSLIFMGVKIDWFNPKGETRGGRALSGIFSIGHSDFVPEYKGKIK